MSDFLIRLIHRTQGSPMLVQPLVVSRFARPPELSAWGGEVDNAASLLMGPRANPRGQGEPSPGGLEAKGVSDPENLSMGHRPLMAEMSVTREYERPKGSPGEESLLPEFNEPQRAVPAASPGRWTETPAAAPEMPAPEPLLVPRSPRAEFFPPTPATGSGDFVDQDLSPWEEAPDLQVAARSPHHIGVRRGPEKMAPAYRPLHPEDLNYGTSRKATEPPPVQVTIGRVEVRAILEAPPPPRSIPPPSPKMSLETYLRQGKEGRR